MEFKIALKNVCSKTVEFEMDNNYKVSKVRFHNGCPGNTQGVAALSEGRSADEIINALTGIRCGFKRSSCPDRFASALIAAKEKIGAERVAGS